jgi:hypothetical protein
MAFNYKTKVYEETATLNLVDPETGVELEVENKPVSITMYGQASAKHRKAVDALMTKANKRGKRESTLEEKRQESLDFLVALSVSTSNFVDEDEQPISTPEQFKTLYADESVAWIRDQVQEFIGNPLSFMKTAE